MDTYDLNCPICLEPYDLTDHEPRIIPCGHSLCFTCLERILSQVTIDTSCPVCNKRFRHSGRLSTNCFPKNFIVIGIIEKRKNSQLCDKHKSPIEMVCFDCQIEICVKCVVDSHKNHNFEMKDSFLSQVENKARDMLEWSAKIEGHLSRVNEISATRKDCIVGLIENEYKEYIQKLLLKKEEQIKKVNEIFDGMNTEHTFTNEEDKKVINWHNNVGKNIPTWKAGKSVEDAFRILSVDFASILPSIRNLLSKNYESNIVEKMNSVALPHDPKLNAIFEEQMDLENQENGQINQLELARNYHKDSAIRFFLKMFQTKHEQGFLVICKRVSPSLIDLDTEFNNFSTDTSAISKVKINLDEKNLSDEEINFLVLALNYLAHINDIRFVLRKAKLTTIIFQKLLSSLYTFTELKSLWIDLTQAIIVDHPNQINSQNTFILKEIFDIIYVSLPGLKNLSNLLIHFNSSHIISGNVNRVSISLEKLFSTLPALPRISHMSLSFSNGNLRNEALMSLSKKIVKLYSLTSLALDFAGCKLLSDPGLESFSQALPSLTQLTRLWISFNYCAEITDQGFSQFCASLKGLKELTELYVLYKNCKALQELGLMQLSNSLEKLTKLQKLYIDFAHCMKISVKAISAFFNSIAMLSEVRNLSLAFSENNNLNSTSFGLLCDSISKLNLIECFTFDIHKTQAVTDEDISALTNSLANKKNLTNLKLILKMCDQISNKSLQAIGDSLINFPDLKKLEISFDENKGVTEEGIRNLIRSCCNLKKIEQLIVSGNGCKHISDEGANEITTLISSIPSLVELKLNLNRHIGKPNPIMP